MPLTERGAGRRWNVRGDTVRVRAPWIASTAHASVVSRAHALAAPVHRSTLCERRAFQGLYENATLAASRTPTSAAENPSGERTKNAHLRHAYLRPGARPGHNKLHLLREAQHHPEQNFKNAQGIQSTASPPSLLAANCRHPSASFATLPYLPLLSKKKNTKVKEMLHVVDGRFEWG